MKYLTILIIFIKSTNLNESDNLDGYNEICSLYYQRLEEKYHEYNGEEVDCPFKKFQQEFLEFSKKLTKSHTSLSDEMQKFVEKHKSIAQGCTEAVFYIESTNNLVNPCKSGPSIITKKFCDICVQCLLYINFKSPKVFENQNYKDNEGEAFSQKVMTIVDCIIIWNWIIKKKNNFLNDVYFCERVFKCWQKEKLDLSKVIPFAAWVIYPQIAFEYNLEKFNKN